MADVYPMRIEWWQNENDEYNWHAMSGTSEDPGNNEVLFGSVQGYHSKAEMLQNVSTWFPHTEIVPRDGEPSMHAHVQRFEVEEYGGDPPLAMLDGEDA